MKRVKKWLMWMCLPLMLLANMLTTPVVNAEGKELTNVVTDVKIWDSYNGEYLQKNGEGIYQLVQDRSYRFESFFDLSKYDGKLSDGDYFTFTIPAPVTVDRTSFELMDKETNVAVGTVEITSNGLESGGIAKVTLKNLKEYLEKKGGSQVQGVKGAFYTEFRATKVINSETLNYLSSETSQALSHTISVKEANTAPPDYSEGIKKENYSKNGGVMQKEAWTSDILQQSGEYLHKWFFRVNTNQLSYDTLTLRDVIPDDSAPMQIMPETLKVRAGYFNLALDLTDAQDLKAGEDYTVEYNSSYTAFTIKILNTSTRLATNGKPAAYSVFYSTTSPANGTDVINELSITGGDKVLTTSTERATTVHRTVRSTKVTSGGIVQLETGYRITLYKQDKETGKLLSGAEFEITSPRGTKEVVTINKDGVAQSRVYSAEEVATGKFTIVEVKAPKGYVLDKTPIEVTVGQAGVIRTIKNTKEKISLPVSKTWDDMNNQDGKRPSSITVQLLANGKPTNQSLTLSVANQWQAVFENLDKYDENGELINYTIAEMAVEHYVSEILGNMDIGYRLTNRYTPETTAIEGTKTWNDNNNQDGSRPKSIKVNLIKTVDGVSNSVATKIVTADDNWQYRFADLPKFEDGVEINYRVTEEKVEGYETSIEGYNITNTHTPSTINISGQKTWRDSDNQDGKRPKEIVVNLLANGVKVASQTVTADTNWSYQFNNLPEYKNGERITYTVSEEAVPEYETHINGLDITNSYTPKRVTISGQKIWEDSNNQDGKRPIMIKIQILNGEEVVDELEVNGASNWRFQSKELPKYENGKEINYTIREVVVPAYETIITQAEDGKYIITNKYSPEKVNLVGEKTWNDNNNQDGIRPSSITVKLLADGQATGLSATVSAESNWKYEFTNLPRYKEGKLIHYTVEEVAIAGYTTEIKGTTIINSHTPEVTSLSGEKTWNDNNNQDGIRPSSITVKLLADGQATGLSATVSAESNWKYEFTNLPRYKEGKLIHYTVEEVAIAGYTTEIKGTTIINSHTPEVTSLSGEKTWNDNNNQDGIRPSSITVKLLADGQATGLSVTVSAENHWKYEFTNLPRYKEGKLIHYTVEEVAIAGYTTEIKGTTIINSHTPEVTSLSGEKMWNDNNDQDGIRPSSITVKLLADGQATGLSATVSAESNWKYEFTNLPRYKEGKLIHYTVEEVAIAGYTTEIKGTTIINSHTPEVTSLSGKKTWNDNNNQDGIRPSSITVKLLADGQATGLSATVSAESNWKYEFTNLPRYKEGKLIHYTVEEVAIAGYTTEIKDTTIINSHTPEVTSLSGEKMWNDNNNQDGIRPKVITVHLLANGKATGLSVKVSAADGWKYTFKDVAKYKDGKEIVYSVREDTVFGYQTKVEGMNITNIHTPTPPKNDVKKQQILPQTGYSSEIHLTILGLLLIAGIIFGKLYFYIRNM